MTTEKRPMATVAVPVFNAEKYLNQCIESITSQTYKDFELILLPGTSSDNSTMICEEWVKKDPRIRIVVQDRNNLSYARNLSLKNAKGKYLCFCDADDKYCSEYLEKMITRAESDSADVVECMFYISNEDFSELSIYTALDRVKTWGHDYLERHCAPAVWKYIVRVDYLCRNGFFYPETKTMEDLASYSLIFSMTDRISYVFEPLYIWRIVDESLSHKKINPESRIADFEAICSYIGSQFRQRDMFEKKRLTLLSQIENHTGDIFAAIDENSDMGAVADSICSMIKKYYGVDETLFEYGVFGWGYHDLETLLIRLRKNPTKALNFIGDAKVFYLANNELQNNLATVLSNGSVRYFILDFMFDALEMKNDFSTVSGKVNEIVGGIQILANLLNDSSKIKVFLIERYLCEKYISGDLENVFDDICEIRAVNEILAKMYEIFMKMCPKALLIKSIKVEENIAETGDVPVASSLLKSYYYEEIMDEIHRK